MIFWGILGNEIDIVGYFGIFEYLFFLEFLKNVRTFQSFEETKFLEDAKIFFFCRFLGFSSFLHYFEFSGVN